MKPKPKKFTAKELFIVWMNWKEIKIKIGVPFVKDWRRVANYINRKLK